jgi:hypothetical protein
MAGREGTTPKQAHRAPPGHPGLPLQAPVGPMSLAIALGAGLDVLEIR